jgi:hypothetical protein
MLRHARILLLASLVISHALAYSPGQPENKAMPEFVSKEAPFMRAIALDSVDMNKINYEAGEWLLVIDRHFAWGNTREQLAIVFNKTSPTIIGYSFDTSDNPIEVQLQEQLKNNPQINPIQMLSMLKYKKRKQILSDKLPQWLNTAQLELNKLKRNPEIPITDLDAHMVIIKVESGSSNWWAIRYETQNRDGYKWLESACVWAEERFGWGK